MKKVLSLALVIVMLLSVAFVVPAGAEEIDFKNKICTIENENGGYNVITVQDGKIGVSEATCPDHYCMKRGLCNSGTEIVCLPNRMTIRFLGAQEIDAIIG